MNKIMHVATTTVFAAAMAISSFAGQAGTAPAPAPTKAAATTATKAATTPPTAQEVTDAKGKGLVWANTNSRVYHTSDAKFYGTTKHGKFMTKDDAEKAGFKAAKDQTPKVKVAKAVTPATPAAK